MPSAEKKGILGLYHSLRSGKTSAIGLAVSVLAALLIFNNPFALQRALAQQFDNARVADCGLAELGTTRPTGWDQPGECIKSVQRWVAEAGGYFGWGGVISGYTNSGAVQVSATEATKGDVLQWTTGDDNDWSHPHTMVIVKNYGNGRFWIVHSNWDAPGLVSENRNWDPDPEAHGRAGYYPMYWRFGELPAPPPVTGGHDVVGAAAPARTFYFAEGTTRTGFDTYFCLQNPGKSNAVARLTYMKGDGKTATLDAGLPASSRVTVHPADTLGTGDGAAFDFSTRVVSLGGQPIVVERPTYFTYKTAPVGSDPSGASWTGGHDVIGATAPAMTFYFAEGTTRPGFDTYFCLQNPGTENTVARLTYMKGDGKTATQDAGLPASSRITVHPADVLGSADDSSHDFSTVVVSLGGTPIVVERPTYFNYKGVWDGGSDVVGATSPAATFFFAEGSTRPGFDPWFCLQNPGTEDAVARLTYMKGDGKTATQEARIPACSRVTVHPADVLGSADDSAHDFSTVVVSLEGQPIVVERPTYFNYKGTCSGGTDVAGATAPAATSYFAEGTTRPGFDPWFCIQNPGSSAATVRLTYMKGDGKVATQQLGVPPASRATVHPADALGSADDAAHDFSTLVVSTGGQPIVVERPTYFTIH